MTVHVRTATLTARIVSDQVITNVVLVPSLELHQLVLVTLTTNSVLIVDLDNIRVSKMETAIIVTQVAQHVMVQVLMDVKLVLLELRSLPFRNVYRTVQLMKVTISMLRVMMVMK